MTPVLYATEEAWEQYLKEGYGDYPLWIRNVVRSPEMPPGQWTIWQYSNRGKLSGYTGEETFIDLNLFYGGEKEWETFLNGPGTVPPHAGDRDGAPVL